MPLSPPVERDHLHSRRYEFGGYRRADGLWDIEGRMLDTKSYGFANHDRGEVKAGEPLHEMAIRLTLDEDFIVRDVEAVTEAGPYRVCPEIAANYRKIIGLKVGAGWRRALAERLGGTEGCTHLSEMLGAMATVAFQTLYPVIAKKGRERAPGSRPPLLDSCHAFRSDGEIAKRLWPDIYTGT